MDLSHAHPSRQLLLLETQHLPEVRAVLEAGVLAARPSPHVREALLAMLELWEDRAEIMERGERPLF